MMDFSCWCNCKCWGDCYTEDFFEDEICGDCECHGDGSVAEESESEDGEPEY